MPRHDLECQRCGEIFEASVISGRPCPRCRSREVLWLPKFANTTPFEPFYHPHLDHEPVLITSARQFDAEAMRRGKYVPPSRTRERHVRLPKTSEEARHAF